MKYRRIRAKTALNKLNSKYLPYKYDLNIYRGCSHGCKYCYALYSHQYLEDDPSFRAETSPSSSAETGFFSNIFIKENIVELLEKRLSSKRWKRQAINLGGVTDSYQAIEAKEKIMPRVLKIFIKYQNPLVISTKSKLILRDIELFEKLAEVAQASLAVSLTTFDEKIYKKTEPYSSLPVERLEVLKKFRKTKVNLGVLGMPILPYLTDNEENLSELFYQISQVPVDFVFCGLLNLRGRTRGVFLNFIQKEFPQVYQKYLQLYETGFCRKDYSRKFYQKVGRLKRKFGIKNKYVVGKEESQLELF